MRLAMIGEIEENGDENSGENVDENSEESNDVADAVADGDIVVDFEETVGDLAAVLSVERLEAKDESADADEVAEKAKVRKTLEDIREQQESALDSTYNIKFDVDDLP
jgi:hypothetical protein